MINDNEYQEGKILQSSWGYEQTNVDFYKIVKRTAKSVLLQEIGKIKTESGNMSGEAVPDISIEIGKPFRRKLLIHGDSILGCHFEYGTIRAWEGRPAYYSTYA